MARRCLLMLSRKKAWSALRFCSSASYACEHMRVRTRGFPRAYRGGLVGNGWVRRGWLTHLPEPDRLLLQISSQVLLGLKLHLSGQQPAGLTQARSMCLARELGE